MFPRKLRFWLAVILFVVAVALILASVFPTPRLQQVLPIPTIVLPAPTPVSWIILTGAA